MQDQNDPCDGSSSKGLKYEAGATRLVWVGVFGLQLELHFTTVAAPFKMHRCSSS